MADPIVHAPPPLPAAGGSVSKGVWIALAFTVGTAIVTAGVTLVAIALVEWVWIVPLVVYFRKRQQEETAKGLLIAGGIIALLNAACWGVVIVSLNNASFR